MSYLTEAESMHVKLMAHEIRHSVIEMLTHAGSGHLAGPLGMADIFAALYFHVLNHKPDEPEWEGRDRLILSNGHIVPVRYAAMAHAGYFPLEELNTLRQFGSRLQGHPERTRLPGLETTSGPLGDGLTQAAGIAYGLRADENQAHVYAILSDGEQQCGVTWEAVMFASANKLGNLTAIIDRNEIQITGPTEKVMPIEPLREKYEAFNWNAITVDGNDVEMFVDAIEQAKNVHERPTVIIANTIPGKGVAEIEGDYEWHGRVPTKEEAVRFIMQLTQERKLLTTS